MNVRQDRRNCRQVRPAERQAPPPKCRRGLFQIRLTALYMNRFDHLDLAAPAAQQRMYALHHIEKNGTGYNMPSVLMLEGVLDTDRLRRAFADLVNRHESTPSSMRTDGML